MTTDPFTEAARAEAEKRWPRVTRRNKTAEEWLDEGMASGFVLGTQWSAAQEPTDAEAQAYLAAFSEDLPPDTTWTPDTIDRVKRGLRAARRDEEKRDG